MGNESARLALFNVTSLIDTNPGCKATISGLKKAINKDFTYQFPIGIGYQFFQSNKKSFFSKSSPFSNVYLKFKQNTDYLSFLLSIDYIVINAEGTIHHDAVGAKALLSFAKFGKELNKKVFIVNGSFYDLNEDLLNILKISDKIFVREKKSFEYLQKKKIESRLIPDCAFLADFKSSPDLNYSCLYTPGVTFTYGQGNSEERLVESLKLHFLIISKKYKNPSFLLIDKKEMFFAELWVSLGGTILDATSLDINLLLERISEFDLVVSGRYHILLFAIMCNVKTIPLTSNTDKIEGLYLTFDNRKISVQDCLTKDLDIDNPIKLDIDLNIIRSNIIMAYTQLFS